MSEKVMAAGTEPAQDESYGATVTAKGLQLLAKIIAAKTNLTLVKVMMGSGSPPEGTYLGDLEDLVEPVVAGTVSEPIYSGSTVEMTVEYRNDLNGGLQEGFIIREFGIFAKDPDGGDVMIFYGNLSKYPQYIAPYTGGGLDIRRYPVSITVAEGTVVVLEGLPSVVMTLDDIKDYCVTTLLPQLLASSKAQIDAHNKDKTAHPDIRTALEETKAQVTKTVESAKQELTSDLEKTKQELVSDLEKTKKEMAEELQTSAGGVSAKITFQDGCAGWNYKITDGADETYTGIVPESLVVEVILRKCSTAYTVTAWPEGNEQEGWSNQVTTGQYFGSIESEVTDFDAMLTVTTAPDATVTAVCGEQRYTAKADGAGSAELKIGIEGRYTVTASLDGQTASGYVTISESKSYALELRIFKTDVNANPVGRFYIDFEPEDWQDGELRFAREEHGLDPAAGICGSFIRGLMGRSVRDMLTEEDAQAAGNAIIAAMAEALSANSAAEADPKPYPPADDGHIPFTWEQTQYAILEGKIAPAEDVARIAEEKGFNWKERDTLHVSETTTLEALLTAAYLPALQGSDVNFRKLCTLETLRGLRLRKKDVPYDVEEYDMDGEMMTIWATWDGKVHFDAQTGDLVLESEKPYAGDLLVLA